MGALIGSTGTIRAFETDLASEVVQWWIGDGLGVLVMAPVLLSWRHRPSTRRSRAETVVFWAMAGGVTAVAFLDWEAQWRMVTPYVAIPVLIWAGLRFGIRLVDQVLREVAERLALACRPGDTVARFGGDEFVILCPHVSDRAEIEAIARRVVDTVSAPMERDGGRLQLGPAWGSCSRVTAKRHPTSSSAEATKPCTGPSAAGTVSSSPTRPARHETSRAGDTGTMTDRNVLGGELEPCGTDPVTGFYRDGCCSTGPDDLGSHTICAVVTSEFLDHQRRIGNDLSTPMPQYRFPGLTPGDRWCVTAANWLRAHRDGAAAPVVLASTHERALEVVPLEVLQEHAVDVPTDAGALEE